MRPSVPVVRRFLAIPRNRRWEEFPYSKSALLQTSILLSVVSFLWGLGPNKQIAFARTRQKTLRDPLLSVLEMRQRLFPYFGSYDLSKHKPERKNSAFCVCHLLHLSLTDKKVRRKTLVE